jgi:hypothetical protein
MTPYELWHGIKPKLSFLKILVCYAYVKCLQPKLDKYVFVGYPKVIVGYSSRTPKTKVFVAENVKFLEKEFFAKGEVGGQ